MGVYQCKNLILIVLKFLLEILVSDWNVKFRECYDCVLAKRQRLLDFLDFLLEAIEIARA